MYITAFLHRDDLFEITNRWFSDQLEPEDPIQVTRIVTYDSFVAWERLLDFAADLNRALCPAGVRPKLLTIKKQLKDFICDAESPKSDRIRHLITEYKKLPEYHYIGSPMAGYLFHDGAGHIVSMCRMKRVKRIAEKASRYATQHISKKIRQTADDIWRENGDGPAAPTPLVNELLARAEKRLMESIKREGLRLPADMMSIRDVLGIKVVRNGLSETMLESLFNRFPEVTIIEKEVHSGNYNATHYIIELKVDRLKMVNRFAGRADRATFLGRGLPEDRILEDFKAFIMTGADTLQLDIILTTCEELIESEIGRSMHEARIFRQRQHQSRIGNIPINIEYLIEYLIAVALSPTVRISEIPIKIWGRYLPDTLSDRIRGLYHMPGYSIITPEADDEQGLPVGPRGQV